MEQSKKYNAIIYEGSWTSEGDRRKLGISKFSNNWIFEIDADEIFNESEADNIISLCEEVKHRIYAIDLLSYNFFISKSYCGIL